MNKSITALTCASLLAVNSIALADNSNNDQFCSHVNTAVASAGIANANFFSCMYDTQHGRLKSDDCNRYIKGNDLFLETYSKVLNDPYFKELFPGKEFNLVAMVEHCGGSYIDAIAIKDCTNNLNKYYVTAKVILDD